MKWGHLALRGALVSLPQGHSSIGRASVSKTEGWGFDSLCPCHTIKKSDLEMADNVKLLAAALLAVAGVAGFYLLADSPTVVRVLSVLAGLMAAAGVVYLTEPGRQFAQYARESRDEARKVVWPTRKETMQMTGLVILFVIVMALFLWAVDGFLFWLVKQIMGRSE